MGRPSAERPNSRLCTARGQAAANAAHSRVTSSVRPVLLEIRLLGERSERVLLHAGILRDALRARARPSRRFQSAAVPGYARRIDARAPPAAARSGN